MNYIEAIRDNRKWISGIFLDGKDGGDYFRLIPEDIRDGQIIMISFGKIE